MTPRSLLTFFIVACNQESFIREAVAGAFAQSYSPLEIILSDDCSTDQTFRIMEEMSAAYQGPHAIKLNRNSNRRGLGSHLNRVMELAEGEFIIGSAGDDISLPRRTEKIFTAWELSGREATSIHSSFITISETGAVIEQAAAPTALTDSSAEYQSGELASFVRTLNPLVSGCTHAFAPALYSYFGPLGEKVTYEDMALSFRTHAIGKMLYINDPLILYRRHSDNLSFNRFDRRAVTQKTLRLLDDKERAHLRGYIHGYEQFSRDLSVLTESNRFNRECIVEIDQAIAERRRDCELRLGLMDAHFFSRPGFIYKLYRNGCKMEALLQLSSRCLPSRLYYGLRAGKNKLSTMVKGRQRA